MPGKRPDGLDMTLVSPADCVRLPTLHRMAHRLAEQIDDCDNAQNLDRLCARLQSVMSQIDALSPPDEGSPADEIRRRRLARRAAGQPVSFDHTEGQGAGVVTASLPAGLRRCRGRVWDAAPAVRPVGWPVAGRVFGRLARPALASGVSASAICHRRPR